jgi:hypothetical protein
MKDVVVITAVTSMFSVGRRQPEVLNLTKMAMYAVLGVSFSGDWSIVLLKG